jgi:hypothetical protein
LILSFPVNQDCHSAVRGIRLFADSAGDSAAVPALSVSLFFRSTSTIARPRTEAKPFAIFSREFLMIPRRD